MSSGSARGRLAPSPTGFVHLGNARTSLVAWLSVRAQGGVLIWRLEDLDQARVVSGLAEAAQEDLRWLGLDWDEGPDVGGPHSPYVQSERINRYEQALDQLSDAGRVFPCSLSRKDLQGIASAPHGPDEESPYPASLRPVDLPSGWLAALRSGPVGEQSVRFAVEPGAVEFEDVLFAAQSQDVSREVGDFVVRRRDGVFAYQLAVVVDDIAMGITEVVRGADLLDSTARQIQLFKALGGSVPSFGHVPLVLNPDGEKLSKRDEGLTLKSLRDHGHTSEEVVGYLAHSLGLIDRHEPCAATDIVGEFAWTKLSQERLTVPEAWADL